MCAGDKFNRCQNNDNNNNYKGASGGYDDDDDNCFLWEIQWSFESDDSVI